MKVFLSIKYYDDMRNKNLIEKICSAIENCGDIPFVFAKNVQNYGKCEFSAEEIMKIAFNEINSSDVLLIDATELSIGIGIEAGYAFSKKIPIYLIAKKDAYVSNSIKGIASKALFYDNPEEIEKLFRK